MLADLMLSAALALGQMPAPDEASVKPDPLPVPALQEAAGEVSEAQADKADKVDKDAKAARPIEVQAPLMPPPALTVPESPASAVEESEAQADKDAKAIAPLEIQTPLMAPPKPAAAAEESEAQADKVEKADKDEKAAAPIEIQAPLMPLPKPAAAAAAVAAASTPPDRWFLQRTLQGTGLGIFLDTERMACYGWIAPGYNASSASDNNAPVTWDDRANRVLGQVFARFEQTVVTSGTTEPTFGFRLDMITGPDYRYPLPRGLWNSQLTNAKGLQSLGGVDLVESYVEAYVPTWALGTDIKVGRFYTPFGSESIEAPTTLMYSRSYAFTSCPPFTHLGGIATTVLDPKWTVQYALVNGNDVWFDQSSEARFVGTVKYTHPNKQDTVTFGTSLGRGKFDVGNPLIVPTFAGVNEPAGRNNINVFDLVWTHVFNPRFTYQMEAIYGYQYGVPANVAGGIIDENLAVGQPGVAHWGSLCHYAIFNWTPAVGTILRFETFDDFEGQRTGFEGLYTEATAGMQFKLFRQASGVPQVMFRPEVRFDYNGYSRPFEGDKHELFTVAGDIIVRW